MLCTYCLLGSALLGGVLGFSAMPEDGYPKTIALPNDALPEGVVGGEGSYLFAGSLADGRIWKIDTSSGSVMEHVAALPVNESMSMASHPAVGLCYDKMTKILWVSGGPSGEARAFDGESGAMLGVWAIAPAGSSFVNDCIVTDAGVYFTNSFAAEFYLLPWSGDGHMLPNSFNVIALADEWEQSEGFNANGIEALADGSLYIVHSSSGVLYHVLPSGMAHKVALTNLEGEPYLVFTGDGILLDGTTLYITMNGYNQIAVFDMKMMTGTEIKTVSDDDFDEVTTIAKVHDRFYGVNAKFATPPPTDYHIVHITGLP